MSQHLTFYTIDTDKDGYPARYMRPDNDWRIERFTGDFGDPGEASQEFQAYARTNALNACYLDTHAFALKAAALAKLRRERARLQTA